ncbi:hypothetical protein EUX98_g5777 [Antrodiella citrinella]|uniref:Uncharacterized protein n=1 Tax=Antrodiella citrinella TaxID=2447956 RepID=A0A4S4MQR7_9APHY|nr:hypothetical protein EUX98_g5777 [Antrodiella citrinella]
MSSDASSSLSVEIQQALHQAVGDANEAANLLKQAKKDKKKKKRAREKDAAESSQVTEQPGDGDGERRKKKKKHDRGSTEEEAVDVETSLMAVDTPSDATPLVGTPVASEVAQDEIADAEKAKKKRKKKKDKGKDSAVEERPTEPPAIAPVEDASAADFLSAVVAAASATSGSHGPPPSSEFTPQLQPYQPHYPYSQPPLGYAYPLPPPNAVYGQAPPTLPAMPPLPDIPGLSLSDLSPEDLLRTLQELDISKIALVLKSLGDAAAATNTQLNILPSYITGPPPGPPPVRQRPVRSDIILGRPPKPTKGASKRPPLPPSLSTTPLQPGDEGNPEHAHMLANVWMNASKLSEMVNKQGLVYKKGKFSAIEEAQLSEAIEHYRSSRGLTVDELKVLIFSKDKGRDSFWPEITAAVHLRPIVAVYHHIRRIYHPDHRQGKWMPTEDEKLRMAVADHGQQWSKISLIVGRMDSDCRDRYRNHLQDSDKRQTGHWTKEEEEQLTQIVTEMTVKQGKDIDNEIFWGVVSTKMGGTRGRQQCRIKWTDSLSTQYKNQGERPRWSQMDAYLLVHKIDSLNVRDDSEIDWKLLPDEHWNSWSAHSLQRRWLTMKRGIKGFEEMSHAEIMDIVRTKKAQSPPPPARKKSKKNPTSQEAIDSDADDQASDPLPIQSAAGSSTGPGTVAAAAADSDSD